MQPSITRLIFALLTTGFAAIAQNSGYSYMTYYFSADGSRLYATTITSGQMPGASGVSHIYTAYTNISGATQAIGCGTASSGWVPAQNYNTVTESCYDDMSYPGEYYISSEGTAYCTDVGRTYYDTGLQTTPVSAPAPPAYMLVTNDYTGFCGVCTTTVSRVTTYRVMLANGIQAGTMAICENVANPNWNCLQPRPPNSTTSCSAPISTNSDGTFTDIWSLNSDAFTPVGCGWDTTDTWVHLTTPSLAQVPFGTLQGHVHTDHISINGVVSPNQLANGTRINP